MVQVVLDNDTKGSQLACLVWLICDRKMPVRHLAGQGRVRRHFWTLWSCSWTNTILLSLPTSNSVGQISFFLDFFFKIVNKL